MINRIIRFSLDHRFVVALFVLLLIIGGVWALKTVNVDSTPDITNNQVQVITVSQNLSTTDIEQYVTYPVEQAMMNLPGVEEVRSISRFGLSVVTIVFRDRMGTFLPRQLVQEKLEEVKEQIPQGMGSPEMGPITTGLGEIYQYTLRPDDPSKYSAQELRTIQDWIVRRQMAGITGVVDVNSFGGSIKQYEVALSPSRLQSMGVTMGEVFDALRRGNANTGGAYIEHNHLSSFIRGEGLLHSLDEVKKIVVKQQNGIPLLIGDVADSVRIGAQVRYGAFTQDGHEAVGGMILMLKGANSASVVNSVKKRIAEVQKSLPKDIKIKPFLDRSQLIHRTTSTIGRNLTESALIVLFVLVLLMGSLRGGFITASVIPLSLLFAFILMKLFGVWANLMSLGAIDFGIIVDGAVIIVEETVHRLTRGKLKPAVAIKNDEPAACVSADAEDAKKGRNLFEEIPKKFEKGRNKFLPDAEAENGGGNVYFQAASSMMHSAFFGQLIILIVFAPILFLSGVSGKMFHPMALTFSFALLGAIILCLTYVPVACSVLLKPKSADTTAKNGFESRLEAFSTRLMGGIEHIYTPILRFSLNHKALIVSFAVVLLVVTGVVFKRMGSEFIPSLDEGDIAMQTFLRPGSSLSETIKREEQVERLLLKSFPEIKTVCARIGVADIPTDPMGFDYTDSFIILEKDRSKWTSARTKEELIEKIKKKLEELPGLNFSFSQPVALRFNELLTGIREDVAVKLYGDDLDTLNLFGERIATIVSRIPGAEDVSVERTSGLPQISVRYDRAKMARYGVTTEQLNDLVSASFAGATAGVVFEGERRFDLVVRLSSDCRQSIDDVRNLLVTTQGGADVPLSEVADISYRSAPMQISRDEASRRIYVGLNVRGRDVASVVEDIKTALDHQITLPAGYRLTYGGEFQNLQQARSRLAVVLPVALLLIFILLYLALKSLPQALMIYIAVPLSTIGGVMALSLRGMPFSISACVGFIVLFGVAVLNGLVLINRFNALKQEGMTDLRQRIFTGTRERLRPILLTATSAMFGFLPMAVSTSAGAEVQRPLSTVVIGGLFSATFLTLIVVPILYSVEEILRRRKDEPQKGGNEGKSGSHSGYGVAPVLTLLISALLFCPFVRAQKMTPLSLDETLRLAAEKYPSLRVAKLEIARRQALKRTAYEVGETELATGGEELGKDGSEAVHTLILVRQNLDLLGIPLRLKYQNSLVDVSRHEAEAAALDLRREVSIDYGNAVVARQRYRAYCRLDSVYQEFERVAQRRYEAQAASRLEFLNAKNQAHQNALAREQALQDYGIALSNLNRWLGDGNFEPDASLEASLALGTDSTSGKGTAQGLAQSSQLQGTAKLNPYLTDSLRLSTHPLLSLAQSRIRLAEAKIKMEHSEMLPKFFVEYGNQKVSSRYGYYSYQIGLSFPLIFGAQSARSKAARLEREAAQADYNRRMQDVRAEVRSLTAEETKWEQTLAYYRTEALPLADEQRKMTLLAYREGAQDYMTFIQNVKAVSQTEMEYLNAFAQWLTARFKLEYFSNTSNLEQ